MRILPAGWAMLGVVGFGLLFGILTQVDALGLFTGSTTTTDTSSASGLDETTFDAARKLSLLRGCNDGQIQKWTAASTDWGCADDETTAVTGAGAVAFDIDDDGNDSNAINEIAVINDANGVWTEAGDKVTVDYSNNVPAADTADALASNPSDCAASNFATTIAANGDLTCAQVGFSDLSGSATDGQIPNTITIDLSATATALAANGANCSAGSAPLGVDESGAVESCTDYEEDLANSAGLASALSDETGTGLAVFSSGPTLGGTVSVTGSGSQLVLNLDCSGNTNGGTLSVTASGVVHCQDDDGGAGSSLALDLGSDGDDSSALDRILTTGDTNSIFTESPADSLLIDLSNAWPAADALSADPVDCAGNEYAQSIDTVGDLTCAQVAFTDLSGSITDGQVPDNITIDLAATATALAANGANCGAGSGAGGVDASGTAEDCTDYEEDLANSAGLAGAISDETGTGAVVFSTSPTLTGTVSITGADTFLFLNLDCSSYSNGGTLSVTSSGQVGCFDDDSSVGAGNVALDLGSDGDDSTAIDRILTTGDTNSIFTESPADSLLIDLSNAWPTADAFSNDPDDCAAGQFAYTIGVTGSLSCAQVQFSDLGGSATDAQIPDNITIDLAATATALASDPTDCSAGQFATTIAASGNLTCAQVAFSDLSGSATDGQIPDTITINLAATATALASDPTDCGANEFANAIAASGNLTCAQVAFSDLSGAAVDGQIPDDITIDLAATATALAADPSNCSAGEGAGGITAAGVAEDCTDYEEDLANSAGLAAAISDETGTGVVVFDTSPTLQGTVQVTGSGTTLTINLDCSGFDNGGTLSVTGSGVVHCQDDDTGGSINSFSTIDASSGTDPVADSSTDTLTITGGTGITVTGDSGADSITIASTVTDTNANTECAGTTTYLDGEGNCDTLDGLEDFETATDDGVPIGTGSGFTVAALPDCNGTADAVIYVTASHSWDCNTFFSQHDVVFMQTGELSTAEDIENMRYYNNTGAALVISDVRCSVNTAPTGATILVDVNENGTTIFTTQSGRPTIAASGNTDVSDTPDDTSWADGNYLQIEIDQVGSSTAGSDLTCQVRVRQPIYNASS